MPAIAAVETEPDWGGLRAASVAVGVREAARQASSHLTSEEQERFVFRVLKRSQREGWVTSAQKARQVLTVSSAKPMSSPVLTGAKALQNVLEDDSRETRISLSKSFRKLAKQAEQAPLEQSGDVLQVAKGAALTHGWATQTPGTGQAMVVNISVLGASPDSSSALQDGPGSPIHDLAEHDDGDPLDEF